MKKINVFMFLIIATICNAQNYTFSTSFDNYVDLVNPISISNGEVWDDPTYQLLLPFDFQINGVIVNNLIINDGYINSSSISSTSDYLFAIGGVDLVDNSMGGETSASPIEYVIEGEIGSRIVKISWVNCGSWGDEDGTMFINFQVWLYETTNIIEYRYGPRLITDELLFYEDETGPIVGIATIDNEPPYNATSISLLTGNSNSPSVSVIAPVYLSGTPQESIVYKFAPTNLKKNEFDQNSIAIFPNPIIDFMTVSAKENINSIAIFNTLGQLVFEKKVNTSEEKIDLTALTSGNYIVKITSETSSKILKIIKQ